MTARYTGREGLEEAIAGEYEAVILDVMLPGMDGFEVLRELRHKSSVPVLMLTAMGEESDRIVGLEMGADDYLPKTFSTARLTCTFPPCERSCTTSPGGRASSGPCARWGIS